MNAAAPQREEIRRRSRKGVPVHELDCDIDVHALTTYVEEHGEGKTAETGTKHVRKRQPLS